MTSGLLRITEDAETDSAYIYLTDEIRAGEAVEQVVLQGTVNGAQVVLDKDADGFVIGIEIIGARRFLRGPGPHAPDND